MSRGLRRRRGQPAPLPFVFLNTMFIMAGIGVAAAVGYPVFESRAYLLTVGAAMAAGALIAIVAERLGRGARLETALAVVAYAGIGVMVATAGTANALTRALDLVRGPVTGWKDIVTLPLPLGSYGATLVPMLALFLVASLLAVRWAIRPTSRWPLAAVTMGALLIVVIVVGPSTRADSWAWVPFGVPLTVEFVSGLALFMVMLAWFSWRAADQRRRALAHAHGATGARTVRAPRSHATAGAFSVVLLLVVATTVATIVAGPFADGAPREVARSVVDPRVTISSTVTPLAAFRDFYTTDAYDAVLFTATATEGSPDRVRTAVLSHFDGQSFTAAAGGDGPATRFQRLPSRIAADGADRVSATVDVGLGGGIWVPLVGELGSMQFHGARRAQLVDGFYYLPDAAAGVMVADGGLAPGDTYTVTGYVPSGERALADLGSPSEVPSVRSDLIPDSLSTWVSAQEVSRDGAGLADLIDRLRARGYLSHALDAQTGVATWQTDLTGYAFVPSHAGHSYDRIDRMFVQLNEREAEVEGSPSASLVAAIGDDEQFAVAAALVAAELGFPSRVVMGARLADTDQRGWAPPSCDDGECRGRHMSAWTEVQDVDGSWVAVDVTPQHEQPPAPDTTTQRDPEFASALDPLRAEPIVPPSTQRGAASDDDPAEEIDDARWLWLLPVLRIVGLSLLVLLLVTGPAIAILVWKAMRRRRRRSGDPTDAVHGGWDEYLDTAIEAGHEPLPLSTRREVAQEYASPNGLALAVAADRATFSGDRLSIEEAAHFWTMVEADRASWRRSRGWWRRWRMALSLRSIWRSVTESSSEAAADTTATAPRWRSEHTAMTGHSRSRRRARSRSARKSRARSRRGQEH